MISRCRPCGRVVGAAHYECTYRKLLFSFGITPVRIGAGQKDSGQLIRNAVAAAVQADLVPPGEDFVVTGGTPLFTPGATNLIQLLQAPEAKAT